MGRIKTQLIKRITSQLVREHRKDFKESFEENKQLVNKFADISSKKMRNTIAGYVTRMVKTKEEI